MKPSKILNYQRSLSPGKAVFFYQQKGNDFVPLPVEVSKIAGQKCSLSEGYDVHLRLKPLEAKELAFANPHTIEACYVPPLVDILLCRFSLRIEANSLRADVCDDHKVARWLSVLAQGYRKAGGFNELARRYAKNILMGNWLWRNQTNLGTHVQVKTSLGGLYEVENCQQLTWQGRWPKDASAALEGLASEIATALSDPTEYCLLDITASMNVGFCQQIHPSQEFVENVERGEPSRKLATVECTTGDLAASFHAEKVGAAIQTIDDWWDNEADYPLRVHEYGANKRALIALRHPSTGKDFYSHLKLTAVYIRRLRHCKAGDGSDVPADIHYMMAVLLKGGMFQRGKA